MEEHFLPIAGGRIFYRKWGQGPQLLIAVHGYAADSRMFEALAQYLSDQFTIYAIDLPFHGATQWNADAYQPEDVQAAIQLILKKEQAAFCSLLGHSFGARIVMKLLECANLPIEHLYLLSPDGIRTRWLGLSMLIPNRLRAMLLAALANWLRAGEHLRRARIASVLPSFVNWFLQKNLSTSVKQERLLGTWRSLKNLVIRPARTCRIIRRQEIKTTIIIGRRDRLLKRRAILRFVKRLPSAALHALPGSHTLDSKAIAVIIRQQRTAACR